MEMSGHLHDPAAIAPAYLSNKRLGWARAAWTFGEKKNSKPCRKSNRYTHAYSHCFEYVTHITIRSGTEQPMLILLFRRRSK